MIQKLLICLLLAAGSCQSLERLGRHSKFWDEPVEAGETGEEAGTKQTERINLWPLFYQNDLGRIILWPIYDHDDQGFALRPLVTKDGSDWEILPPLAWWNTETREWLVVPAYSFEDSWGIFPIMGFGDFNFVGPAYWSENESGEYASFGLFPLVHAGAERNFALPVFWGEVDAGEYFVALPLFGSWPLEDGHKINWAGTAWWSEDDYGLFPLGYKYEDHRQVGPVFWGATEDGHKYFTLFPLGGSIPTEEDNDFAWAGPLWRLDDPQGEPIARGLFPLATFTEHSRQIGPVYWHKNDAGQTDLMLALPLFGYGYHEDRSGSFISLLGARSWDADGQTKFTNVLGPLYNFSQSDGTASTEVVWPLANWTSSKTGSSWRLWPLIGASQQAANGEDPKRSTTWALTGLYRSASRGDARDLRLLPLFAYRSTPGAEAPGFNPLEMLSLVGYQRSSQDRTTFHIATPLGFSHERDGNQRSWSAIAHLINYSSSTDTSEFNLLWFLYRQKTAGTETRRDLFPFISWDSGEQHSKFSFLWRLFNWETEAGDHSGHILFIPWD